ncbi:MAG: lipoate--protein ligase [Alkalibacterium gilvum]|uniref:lipoate--protein ligase n=1 Tax=Alkalibacterium gilvum TaxID=1130080 RepID=A0A1H6TQ80_9LACT|nr:MULTISPECIES: lipoate--protein ligase [Alkalibacterium]MDN6293160.1 lipoate--protein ligase [Alkalibacterium sp.]MDN6294936.1 lipoate--protein ligase [Alkalibacterium sp.]MDN6729799.1 lipoate--protein ligase [Alkalibacterium sp.]SEI77882.1 lipoate-protein ligase A [Alkalibacterium gilvum]HAJ69870.1 lipoate--protein ligase [Alkalibacterium sp.]
MYYVKNERNGKEIHDPKLNLAIEYYLLNEVKLDESILLFYINNNSIIIGRNQNTYEEVNTTYVEENNIDVVRRFSGGGAVYHDMGVLCFCFITEDDGNSFRDFKRFTSPVIDALHQMGVNGAELKGRNDLVINDKKFSGNAMYSKNGRMTAHGTLMFDSEIDAVVKALKPKKHKLESKGIKSIRSRVTNIKPFLEHSYQCMNAKTFRDQLLLYLYDTDSKENVKEYVLTDKDWEKIDAFAAEYTDNWDWNYGKSPEFDMERSDRLSVGTVEVKMNVRKGNIDVIRIYGDFFGLGEIEDVEDELTNIPYTKEAITNALNKIDINKYFGSVDLSELVDLIY